MKSLKLNSPALDSVKLSAILRDTLFKDAEYYSEKNMHPTYMHYIGETIVNIAPTVNLYSKCVINIIDL